MSDFAYGFATAVLVLLTVTEYHTKPMVRNGVMSAAYERGYAVQCAGLEGYHWECPAEVKGEEQ